MKPDRESLRDLARAGWGAVADDYVRKLWNELDDKPFDRDRLARFAALVPDRSRRVLDLGCGPGHVSKHLASAGLAMHGIDLSPEMVALATRLVPEATFERGDLLDLSLAPRSFGGALLLYSIINLVREDVPGVLASVARALVPGAPLLLATHAGEGFRVSEAVFEKPVRMIASMFSAEELTGYAESAGFEVLACETRPPYPTEYPSERVYLLARALGGP